MSNKPFKVAIAVGKSMAESIFSEQDIEVLTSFADINPIDKLPETVTPQFIAEILQDADACITCWGTPGFTEEMLSNAPKLRLIAHSAGSIKNLIPNTYWETGSRRITSNAPLIAKDVAQTFMAFTLCSLRGLWGFAKSTEKGEWSGGEASLFKTRSLEGLTVGLIGGSNVAKEVINVLKPYNCKIKLYDPYISAIEANELGVTLTNLDELIASSDIVSLHAPGTDECKHMINASNVSLIKNGALFINTARGILVDEPALIKELQKNRFFACIDVTDPEPPAKDHPFRTMENVILTPHIAGGHTADVRKSLGKNSIKKVFKYLHTGILDQEVRKEMLDRMA